MQQTRKLCYGLLVCGLIAGLLTNGAANTVTAPEKSKNATEETSLSLSELVVGEGDSQIKFVFDLNQSKKETINGKKVYINAIADFTLPFNKLNSTLNKNSVGGIEKINQVEVSHDSQKKQTGLD